MRNLRTCLCQTAITRKKGLVVCNRFKCSHESWGTLDGLLFKLALPNQRSMDPSLSNLRSIEKYMRTLHYLIQLTLNQCQKKCNFWSYLLGSLEPFFFRFGVWTGLPEIIPWFGSNVVPHSTGSGRQAHKKPRVEKSTFG